MPNALDLCVANMFLLKMCDQETRQDSPENALFQTRAKTASNVCIKCKTRQPDCHIRHVSYC